MTQAKKYLQKLIDRQPDSSSSEDIVRALAIELVMRRTQEAESAIARTEDSDHRQKRVCH